MFASSEYAEGTQAEEFLGRWTVAQCLKLFRVSGSWLSRGRKEDTPFVLVKPLPRVQV